MDEQARLRREALDYLASHQTLTLATTGPDGPWAATVFYAELRFRLYFLSNPATRHGRNLAASPHVAATIDEDYRDWRTIKGIQLEGACRPVVDSRELEQARAAYLRKFPFARDFLGRPEAVGPEVAARVERVTFYVVLPTRLWYLDNSRGFGYRREVFLPEPEQPG